MFEFIGALIKKVNLNLLIAIIFGATLLITYLPNPVILKIGLEPFKKDYQMYIGLALVLSGLYLILITLGFLGIIIFELIFSPKKIGLKYLENTISTHEIAWLVKYFYNDETNSFNMASSVSLSDGMRAPLEQKHIIYRSANMSDNRGLFQYNLQSFAISFLEDSIQNGSLNINLTHDGFIDVKFIRNKVGK